MANLISGPGIGLPLPQNLYPTELGNAPYDLNCNTIVLPPGATLPIPAGRWFVDPGAVSLIQFQDPVTGIWRSVDAQRGQAQQVLSDGFTRRVANLTGCPVSAVVAGGGSGFTQSTATITANIGGSTWQAIVGGSLSVSTINAAGAKYTVAPLVLIPAPPSPGIQATAYATLTSNTVSSVSLTNFGAGYTATSMSVILYPSPTDPNIGTISNATVTLILNAAQAGAITGALCTNNGNPIAPASFSSLTLTGAGGGGTGATLTPLILQTVTTGSVTAGGGGWTGGALAKGYGGVSPSVSAIVNPAVELTNFRPREASVLFAASSGALTSVSTVYDGGLFLSAPSVALQPLSGGGVVTTLATVTLAASSTTDTITMQPV